jgi:hypothetical protein
MEFNLGHKNDITVKEHKNFIRYSVGSFNYDKWNKIIVDWDRNTGYYKLIFNDNDLGIFPMKTKDIPYRIRMRSGNDLNFQHDSIAYIDDIVFSTNKETINK